MAVVGTRRQSTALVIIWR